MIPNVEPGSLITAGLQNDLINTVNEHTDDISYLMTSGGGTPEHPYVDWFSGEGAPPTSIVGAGRGDMYVDTLTGELYQLQ